MSKKQMKKEYNIEEPKGLDHPKLKENPFSMPDNYYAVLEKGVHKRIFRNDEEEELLASASPFKKILAFNKAYAGLTTAFLVIFGIVYGAIYFTKSFSGSTVAEEEDLLVQLVDAGHINIAMVDNLYDDISLEGAYEDFVIDDEVGTRIQESISTGELLEYYDIYNNQ